MRGFHRFRAGGAAALLALFLLSGFAAPAEAAPRSTPAQLEARRADLDQLKEKIRALQDEIGESEASRNEAADSLRESEQAISESRRELREIAAQRQEVDGDLKLAEAERDALKLELDTQREALGATLYRYYVFGRRAGTRRLLGGDDPNQISRDGYYLERLAEARRSEIESARRTLVRHEALVAEVAQRKAQVAELEEAARLQHQRLVAEQKKRAVVLAQIQDRLRSQRKEVASLKGNETRLAKLIDGLAKLPPPAPRPKSPRRVPAIESASASSKPVETTEIRHAESVADSSAALVDFIALRGKLRWPVRGELVGRFGTPRAEGATQWKGVFIRAESGEVRAVADGRVVYADWLRGFGNLLILDHGSGYMTIYGNNEGLLRKLGDSVQAGEAIASGGGEESGLYFEIRHHGQPQDPAKWVSAR